MILKTLFARLFPCGDSVGRRQFVGALAGISLASAASAASIGVNFVNTGDAGVQNGTGDALGAADVAGAAGYAHANWNNLGRWGNPTGLNDSSGSGTSVNVTWDSNNTWGNGADTSTANGKLMAGYLDATGQPNNNSNPYSGWDNANKPDTLFTGIGSWLAAQGALSYKVIVYSDGDATEGRISEYWLQNATGSDFGSLTLGTDLTTHRFLKDTSNFSGGFTEVTDSANSVGTAGEGNYMVWSGLTADSFLLRSEERDFRAQINGIQIIAEVPEPGTVLLLGLGSLGFLLARRRRS